MNPENILITGGCGFLGSNIAAHYLSQGARVTIIDAMFRDGGKANQAWLQQQAEQDRLKFIQGDLADPEIVKRAFDENAPFDYVCHLGGQVAMTTSLSDPRRDMQTNVIGTFNVLEETRQNSPDALVAFSSTNKVYGDLEDLRYDETSTRYRLADFPDGLDESTPLDFASPYGCSKGAADQYVHDWYRNFGLKSVVFRHSSIYGGRQYSTFDQGWIGWFCRQAIIQKNSRSNGLDIEPFTIAGTGKQVRDVLHAEDLINLYSLAYQNKEQVAGEAFNIGGGNANSLSLLELFELLSELTNQEQLTFEKTPVRKSDQKVFVADISKAKKIMSWEPKITSKQGLEKMIEWVGTSG